MQLSSLHSLNSLSLLLIIRWSSLWFWSLRISLLGSKISSSLNILILLSSSLSSLSINISVVSIYILFSSSLFLYLCGIGSSYLKMTIILFNLHALISSISWLSTNFSQSLSSGSSLSISISSSLSSSLICSTSGI
ncbi:Uncharacterised protein [Chlamydia trachomatis]|nr:Uncharacterised protein [Chlamydia trachomatis]